MSDPAVTMGAYLWDLRAQLEAELRTLTALQRIVEGRNRGRTINEATWRAEVQAQLRELATANAHVREVLAEAMAAVGAAPGGDTAAPPIEPA